MWQFTKPQELHTTTASGMAAFMLLNDGPFVRSHDLEYLNLKQLCACFYFNSTTRESELYDGGDDDDVTTSHYRHGKTATMTNRTGSDDDARMKLKKTQTRWFLRTNTGLQ